jgi:hypothetical protein
MKHTVETIKRISGSAEADGRIADEFCQEALEEATKRLNQIQHVCGLGAILDSTLLAGVGDALAGIRHIHAAMHDVAEFHHNGQLATTLDQMLSQLGELQDKAEGSYRWLDYLYPPRRSDGVRDR